MQIRMNDMEVTSRIRLIKQVCGAILVAVGP